MENPRQELILGKHNDDNNKDDIEFNPKYNKWWFKVMFSDNGIWRHLIIPEKEDYESMNKWADNVIDFLIKKLIPWWVKALAELWADDTVIKFAIRKHIEECIDLLEMSDEERKDILEIEKE